MDFKLVGSILLIVGTCVGAGMLALPLATAPLGFLGSVVLLIGCWLVMTAAAFLLLEVNLWLPLNNNIISMARETIGPVGQFVAWLAYLALLYSLLCAYIAGGSDLFHYLISLSGLTLPSTFSAIIFTLLFGFIVFLGIQHVDYVNRGLMFIKFAAYFILIALLLPLIAATHLNTIDLTQITSSTAITVTITSFGFSVIIPSLRIYLNGDVKKLKLALLIGSLIPLICYILWDMAIMGMLPLNGEHGLLAILNSSNSTSTLAKNLSAAANYPSTTIFIKLFTSVCVLTSFLGVALCMVDFLADGLHLEKAGMSKFFLHLLALLPPLILVLFYPGMFVKALEYAGIYSAILLILLPAWMAWQGRYRHKLTAHFTVPGGRLLLILLILFSLFMIVKSLTG